MQKIVVRLVLTFGCATQSLGAANFSTGQVLETSDVPAGVVNLITASVNDVLKPMSTHAEVQAIWVFDGDGATTTAVERESAATLMRTWVPSYFDPMSLDELSVQEFLEQATQVKNVWIPYGV